MKTVFASTTFVIFFAAATAQGATLSSAAISGFFDDFCSCTVSNQSTKDVEATVEIVDGNGAVVTTQVMNLPAGEGAALVDSAPGSNNPHYCRISGKFSKKKLKAVYCVMDGAEATTVGRCVPLD